MPRAKNQFVTRLERERKAGGLTQVQLARLADVTQSTISKLERQKMPKPSASVVASLVWALNKVGRKVDVRDLQPRRQHAQAKEVLERRVS
jgi:transcriptional regulator with XRE-family HTH domain